ncbi:hypothetical protein UFOVP154_63 [uncultured Caudovirales phage]|uniref:Uncharacterized protein n=1 Tax=uncultured Caudovirales phage TaxID=2100421 RepID=A0A6J7W967_9CAUD|nr:hypothetical protein UFOVP8_48 [uncultured Caudovirales phage]CAB5171011.1 hypothetical protein UFOVP154_63 [uncultured Caudovirales phage]
MSNHTLPLDCMAELDRLYECACRAHHAYRLARADTTLAPGVMPFGLAREYQQASKALADYVRQVKAGKVMT